MEPLIPDGSLCVFRSGVTGSRQGRLVLVEALGRGSNDRYTVKRYHSEKAQDSEGAWTHSRDSPGAAESGIRSLGSGSRRRRQPARARGVCAGSGLTADHEVSGWSQT